MKQEREQDGQRSSTYQFTTFKGWKNPGNGGKPVGKLTPRPTQGEEEVYPEKKEKRGPG